MLKVATGALWFSSTMTCKPLASFAYLTLSVMPAWARTAAPVVKITASMEARTRGDQQDGRRLGKLLIRICILSVKSAASITVKPPSRPLPASIKLHCGLRFVTMTPMANELSPFDEHALYRVKGMLTKFMRMIFPLEFRIDSLPNSGATLPFHYPLIGGEMIYLPESVSGVGGVEMAHDYYVLTAAHLAGRHEFGTFDFELADCRASRSAPSRASKRSTATSHRSTIQRWRARCCGCANRPAWTRNSAGDIGGSRRGSPGCTRRCPIHCGPRRSVRCWSRRR